MTLWLRTSSLSNHPSKNQGSEYVYLHVVSTIAVRLSLSLSISYTHNPHNVSNKGIYSFVNECSLFIRFYNIIIKPILYQWNDKHFLDISECVLIAGVKVYRGENPVNLYPSDLSGRKCLVWFDLLSLFHEILNFVDYLEQKPSLLKKRSGFI